MSDRNVAAEILALLALVNAPGGDQPSEKITVDEIKHFVLGRSNSGNIEIVLAPEHCAVIVAIEEFNVDPAQPRGIVRTSAGWVTDSVATNWLIGGDLFLVFPPGTGLLTFTATALAGTTYAARVVGFKLPHAALRRLRSVGTKFPS